jgi:hypothetical protein
MGGGGWGSEEEVVGVELKACAAAAVSPVFTATRETTRVRSHCRLGGNISRGRKRFFSQM